jgi:regulator of protease activity HflC (stomatin/prohibitin superfamily)
MTTYAWLSGRRPTPGLRRGWRSFVQRHLSGVAVALMVALLIGFVLYPYALITVPSGSAGVLWKRFSGPGIYCWCILPSGTVLDPLEIRHEGLHFIWPWDKLFLYDLRLQSSNQKFNAISSDGVSVTAEITIRYQLNVNSVAVLHEFIGPAYLNTVLIPEIGSVTRAVIANYTAEEVYSTKRQKIQEEIKDDAVKALREHLDTLFQAPASVQESPTNYENYLQNSITILDTPVLSIDLPPEIVAAINQKIEQFYKIKEYQYRAEREVEESKRKQIEANGIAAFQRTVSKGISDSYLRWQGIQATLALAQSPNTKIVIIGSSKDGLPLILGNLDTLPSSSPGKKPGEGGTPPTGNPPASAPEKTPPGTSSKGAPAGAPTTAEKQNPGPGSAQPSGTSQRGSTPPASKSKPSTGAAKPSTGAAKPSSSSLDLSDIKAILSRLSDALRSTGSGKSSDTGAGSK